MSDGELRASPREHARLGTEPIDGLRGFGLLVVLFYHTWLFSWLNPSISLFGHDVSYSPLVRPGYLGVEVFFVISAFCLAFPYVAAHAHGAKVPTLLDFTRRRVLKIVPSYLLALLATFAFAASAQAVPANEWAGVIAEHVFFLQNFHHDALGNQNSVLWSLAVEVQFYVAFPALMYGFSRKPLPTAILMILVAVLYRHINMGCCLHDEDVTRMLPAYLDLFAIGMLAAWAVVYAPKAWPFLAKHKWIPTAIGIAAAYSMLAQMGYVDDRTYDKDSHELFVTHYRTFFGLAVGVCAAASCLGYTWWRKIVGNPVLTALSLVSYNVYLWHTMIEIFLAEHGIPYSTNPVPHNDEHWRIPFIIISFATIAFVTIAITYFFERPILGFIKPQSFSYPWPRLWKALRGGKPAAPSPIASVTDAGTAAS